MRKIVSSAAFAASLLVSAQTARAEEPGTINHAGNFACGTDVYSTNWVTARDLEGALRTTVYFQETGSSNVQWLKLRQGATPDGTGLVDENGNLRLRTAEEGDVVDAAWALGAPSDNCRAFKVTRSEDPKARFDALFALLDTGSPTVETATEVTRAMESQPIVFALPELDQQDYMQKLAEKVPAFWQRYRDALTAAAAGMQLSSDAEIDAYAAMLRGALSDTMVYSMNGRDREGRTAMKAMLQIASDRLADAGKPMAAAFDPVDPALFCQRLTLMKRVQLGSYNLDDLEFAVGVSFGNWTRALAETVVRDVKACGDREHFLTALTEEWPNIQRQQETLKALKAERDRMLGLPRTLQTLVDTANLTPDRQKLTLSYEDSDMVERVFGKALEPVRGELFEAAMTELKAKAGDAAPIAGTIAQVEKTCEKLPYLDGLTPERQQAAATACTDTMAALSKKEAEAVISRIEAAFRDIDPLSQQAVDAQKLCKELDGTSLSMGARDAVYGRCRDELSALETKQETARCDRDLASSGADDSLLDANIEVKGLGLEDRTTVRELVCNVAKREGRHMKFHTEGMLMWAKQFMDLSFDDRPADGATLEMKQDEKSGDWKVVSWVGDIPREVRNLAAEDLTSCLFGTPTCPMH